MNQVILTITFLVAVRRKMVHLLLMILLRWRDINSTEGVKLLQTPNRKTGEIDYKGAFDLFNQSAQVGQFAPAYYNAGFTAESLEQYDPSRTSIYKSS